MTILMNNSNIYVEGEKMSGTVEFTVFKFGFFFFSERKRKETRESSVLPLVFGEIQPNRQRGERKVQERWRGNR